MSDRPGRKPCHCEALTPPSPQGLEDGVRDRKAESQPHAIFLRQADTILSKGAGPPASRVPPAAHAGSRGAKGPRAHQVVKSKLNPGDGFV